jgi:S1-C subfamily serine protease
MENADNQKDEDFSLYTENIVLKPTVKYKKFIDIGRFILAAVLFGAIASAVMLTVYPAFSAKFLIRNTQKEELTIQKDEYPTDDMLDTTEDSEQFTVPADSDTAYQNMAAYMREKAAGIMQSLVVIDVYKTDVDDILSEVTSSTETVGIVIGLVNSQYIILTNSQVVGDFSSIVVKFTDSVEVNGTMYGRNDAANLAVISVKESDIPSNLRSSIVAAQLDNSYNIRQGDIVIAAGRLYGQIKAVDYGVVTGITTKSSTDNAYEIFNTGLAHYEDDYGYLFNTEGNVIGISVSGERTTFAAVGISDLKSIIQNLSNEKETPYLGIKGQNITSSMATVYGLPMGIYITGVALDSPAFEAGLQSGDVITAFNENMVLTIQAFSEKLYQCNDGEQIEITVKRLGKDEYKEMTFTAVVTTK